MTSVYASADAVEFASLRTASIARRIRLVGNDALLHGDADFLLGDEQARVPARG